MRTNGPAPSRTYDFTALHDSLVPQPDESRQSQSEASVVERGESPGGGPALGDGTVSRPEAVAAVEENEPKASEWDGKVDPVQSHRLVDPPRIPSTFVGPGVWILPSPKPVPRASAGPSGTPKSKPMYFESSDHPDGDAETAGDSEDSHRKGGRPRIPLDFVGPGVWSRVPRRLPPGRPGDAPPTEPST
jgi:hypothetical protein